MFLRVILADGSPPAQLFVEETAEDVTPLSHEAPDSLQEEISAEEETIQDTDHPYWWLTGTTTACSDLNK